MSAEEEPKPQKPATPFYNSTLHSIMFILHNNMGEGSGWQRLGLRLFEISSVHQPQRQTCTCTLYKTRLNTTIT